MKLIRNNIVCAFPWLTISIHLFHHGSYRASGRSRKKSQILRDFQGQIRGKNGRFRRNFRGQFCWKMIGKEWPISRELPEKISVRAAWIINEFENVVRTRTWLICYLLRTSINFAHSAGFSAIIIRGLNHSEIDHHLCRRDERIRHESFTKRSIHEERANDKTRCRTLIPSVYGLRVLMPGF